MRHSEIPTNVNPLVHSGTVITKKPRRKTMTRAGGRDADAGETVSFDSTVISTIATFGNYSKRRSQIHFALWRAVAGASIGGRPNNLSPEWLYDAMGGLASTMRHAEAETPATFHYALNRVQTTLTAMHRMEKDPIKQRQASDPRMKALKRILLAIESALSAYLRAHPGLVLSHAQWAGLEPKPDHDKNALGKLGAVPELRKERLKTVRARARQKGDAPAEHPDE